MARRPASTLDAKGCLTPAGVRLLQQAPPGGGPPELAAHVARCARCQDRVLAQDLGGEARPPARTAPPLWRALLIFGVGFLLALLAVAITARLRGAGAP
jgi:hypothetical protein